MLPWLCSTSGTDQQVSELIRALPSMRLGTCADHGSSPPEDLQKEMIIPRPRSPSPEAQNGVDLDFANLSKEEIERLTRERHAEFVVSCSFPFIFDLRS